MTSNVSGDTFDVIGLINGWGEMRLLMDNGHLIGFPTAIGTAFTADLIGITAVGFTWPDNSTTAEFSLGGTYSPDRSISANYSGAGEDATISLTYDPISERGSRIGTAAGTWVQWNNSQNIAATFTVSNTGPHSGRIDGTDVDGCVYSGELDTWTSEANVYDVPSVTVSNCPVVGGIDLNGDYAGSGVVTDNVTGSNQNDIFIIGVASETQIITVALEKL